MWCFYFWRENEAEGQGFIPGAGAQFQPRRDLWMVVIRESLRESSVWCVGQVLSVQGVYRFDSPWRSRLWVAACRCSHLIVCLVYYGWIWGVGYGYGYGHDYIAIMIIVFTYLWCWHGSTFCLFMLALVCRCKHSTWLKLKMAKIIKAKDQLLVVKSSVLTTAWCLACLGVGYLWPRWWVSCNTPCL
jgi:hypothetical protein